MGAKGMEQEYDRDAVVGVLGNEPIPKIALSDEEKVSRDVAIFLLFIHELNRGTVG